MKRYLRWFAPLAAMAAVVLMTGAFWQTARAADNKLNGSGKITVTVNDANGNPVVGAQVTLHAKPSDSTSSSSSSAKVKTPSLATGKTDKDGKFTFDKVPVGDFVVLAHQKTGGNGKADASVTDESSPVDVTVTLKAGKSSSSSPPSNSQVPT